MPGVLQEHVNVVVLGLTAEKMDTPGGLKGESRPPLCVPYFSPASMTLLFIRYVPAIGSHTSMVSHP